MGEDKGGETWMSDMAACRDAFLYNLLAEPAFAEAPAVRKASGGGAMRRLASSLAGESRDPGRSSFQELGLRKIYFGVMSWTYLPEREDVVLIVFFMP